MATIRTTDVLRYAESKTGGLKCPLCGNTEFEPVPGREGKPIALLHEESGRSWFGPPGYLRVYTLACTDCSHLLLFAADRVESWTEGRGTR